METIVIESKQFQKMLNIAAEAGADKALKKLGLMSIVNVPEKKKEPAIEGNVLTTGKIAPVKKVAEKSIYTLKREAKFRKTALKKYAARIAAIQEVFPDWNPEI